MDELPPLRSRTGDLLLVVLSRAQQHARAAHGLEEEERERETALHESTVSTVEKIREIERPKTEDSNGGRDKVKQIDLRVAS